MTNNDILRRIRYTFNYDDSKVIFLFGSGGQKVTRAQISDCRPRKKSYQF